MDVSPAAKREPLERVMGIILKFEALRKGARRAAVVGDRSKPCEIIILPCIRYERAVDGGSKPTPQKKKARKRPARAR